MKQAELKIWETIQDLNHCWTCGDPSKLEKLNDYFHETMVAIVPTEKHRIEGKKACVEGWAGFANSAKIHSWREFGPKIQIYGNTAVVTCYFEIVYEMGGRTIRMGGRDMFCLVNENGKWMVVADQFSPYP